MMKERIIVIGGYGHVGQTICQELAEQFPGNVYAAGRSLERAESFSRSTAGKVQPLQLNIGDNIDPSTLDHVKLVIMCLDQTDTTFVQTCLNRGIHYIDVSAHAAFLSQVEQLHVEASGAGATAILSVGLAPGLTNLLALHAKNYLDQLDTVDISIMLGLGDKHGQAAIEWTIDNLNTTFEVMQNGYPATVASFTEGRKTSFGAKIGRKTAYRFNFSDQYVLPRTLGVPTVATRLCFDSAAVTQLLAGLKVAGILNALTYKPIRKVAVQLFSKLQFGEEHFAVKVEARGHKDGVATLVEYFVHGKHEADVTARVAAAVAAELYRSSFSHGVYHIEQQFHLHHILGRIEQLISLETRINGTPLTV
ncbi:saccharopine dehydrogenase family protein [Paenibacillus sp. 481]|uniref:saccharopine dehydrogenase family protein n=1 Tax=Paenibacillus sp. 481 TaxID=2835869 RepID=UPI001E50A380|nr:saccharopine dehydrogenase NADP-binding domain-containing protein [Paenibacillus sp. 481]UHA75998.1 saccharopine dehydrogenase NADP-binding domain-containing protein [Paenibacillus sp. 481]